VQARLARSSRIYPFPITRADGFSQTALLRQLLTSDKYHVLHFDLRIAGFADLDSLYISLSQQAEQYFNLIADTKGYEDFEKEAWSFKVLERYWIYIYPSYYYLSSMTVSMSNADFPTQTDLAKYGRVTLRG
jgi:hypothetical protein